MGQWFSFPFFSTNENEDPYARRVAAFLAVRIRGDYLKKHVPGVPWISPWYSAPNGIYVDYVQEELNKSIPAVGVFVIQDALTKKVSATIG